MNEKAKQSGGGNLQLAGVRKNFDGAEVVRGVDLTVAAGEFAVFVGPSGCGKSTLLRMIAGLEDVSAGKILLDGQDISGEPPANRQLAMVFQSYALYPHLTVRQNLGFSLKMAGAPADAIAQKTAAAAATLRLSDLLDRYPKQLSGGQRQRVAIGRAIVRQPRAFLFDEPLSNLDAALRAAMRLEIAKLRDSLRATMIYVTHDQVEAMTLADKIVVLRDGAAEQIGVPRELYEKPANKFVAQFIGSPKMNIIENLSALKTNRPPPPAAVALGVRAEHLAPCAEAEANISGEVELAEYLGGDVFAYIHSPAGRLTARLPGNATARRSDKIHLRFPPEAAHYFNAQERRIS